MKHVILTAVVLFLAVAIAVASFPTQSGVSITGRLTSSVKPSIDTSVTTTAKNTNAKESNGAETISKEDVAVAESFWKSIFKGLLQDSANVEVTTSDTDESACCADPRLDEITDTVNDMQDRIDVLENRLNQPCSSTTITSGSCDTACSNMGLKCTGAMTVRTRSEELLFGGREESVLFTESADCDYDWYMAFPEVFDERSCFCC